LYGTKVEKIEKNQSFTTTDEEFLEKLSISIPLIWLPKLSKLSSRRVALWLATHV
ncbi:hypothetical protein Gogos_020704, partial [Gossypium gossypioides]|nr:hypothetical protein [Gossypium gossypioides]